MKPRSTAATYHYYLQKDTKPKKTGTRAAVRMTGT